MSAQALSRLIIHSTVAKQKQCIILLCLLSTIVPCYFIVYNFLSASLPGYNNLTLVTSPYSGKYDVSYLYVDGNGSALRVKMALYPFGDLISDYIRLYHQWEATEVKTIVYYLNKDEDMHLVDIGSHLGVFTLNAATLRPGKRQVVAVDSDLNTCQLLYKSAQLNHLTEQISIIYAEHLDVETTKSTINLDDLLQVISFKSAVVRFGLELSHTRIFETGYRLFKTLHIPFVMVAWQGAHRTREEWQQMFAFFAHFNYRLNNVDSFMGESYGSWPDTIEWVLDA